MISDIDVENEAEMLERVERSMHRAFWKAVETHRRAGVPLAVVRNGKVVQLSAEEILAEYAAKNNGELPSTNGQTK